MKISSRKEEEEANELERVSQLAIL